MISFLKRETIHHPTTQSWSLFTSALQSDHATQGFASYSFCMNFLKTLHIPGFHNYLHQNNQFLIPFFHKVFFVLSYYVPIHMWVYLESTISTHLQPFSLNKQTKKNIFSHNKTFCVDRLEFFSHDFGSLLNIFSHVNIFLRLLDNSAFILSLNLRKCRQPRSPTKSKTRIATVLFAHSCSGRIVCLYPSKFCTGRSSLAGLWGKPWLGVFPS